MSFAAFISIGAVPAFFFTALYALHLRLRLAALTAEREAVSIYARDLAEALHEEHYASADWQVAHDLMEIMLQIDNMTTELHR